MTPSPSERARKLVEQYHVFPEKSGPEIEAIADLILLAVEMEREACRITAGAAANECCREYVYEAIRSRTHLEEGEGK